MYTSRKLSTLRRRNSLACMNFVGSGSLHMKFVTMVGTFARRSSSDLSSCRLTDADLCRVEACFITADKVNDIKAMWVPFSAELSRRTHMFRIYWMLAPPTVHVRRCCRFESPGTCGTFLDQWWKQEIFEPVITCCPHDVIGYIFRVGFRLHE